MRGGTVFDIGYQNYAGAREGRGRGRFAIFKDGVRTALGTTVPLSSPGLVSYRRVTVEDDASGSLHVTVDEDALVAEPPEPPTQVASIAASRSNRHLRIDLVSHFVPERYARLPRLIVDAFAAGVCGLLAWQLYKYLQLTREFGDTLVTGIDIPAWWGYGIIPLAFAIMSYRFLMASFSELGGILSKDTK